MIAALGGKGEKAVIYLSLTEIPRSAYVVILNLFD